MKANEIFIGIAIGVAFTFAIVFFFFACATCHGECIRRPKNSEQVDMSQTSVRNESRPLYRKAGGINNDDAIDVHPSRLPTTIPINVPTRGEAPDFQQVGVLIGSLKESESDTESVSESESPLMLPLYGRQLHGRSDRWEYFVGAEKRNMWRLPITVGGRDCGNRDVGCNEIYDGDEVFVPAYKKSFKASIYKLDTPRYI